MDIIKQISILLWVLGAILIAPPILRHFDIDVKEAYAKILAIDTKKKDAFDQPTQKKDIAPENPDTTMVSGFFRAPIFKCKQKDIFLC